MSQKIDSPSDRNIGKATQRAAELLQTNRQYISEAKKLSAEDPEEFRRVKAGDATLTDVKRQKTEAKRESRREQNRQLAQATNSLADLVGNAHFSYTFQDQLTLSKNNTGGPRLPRALARI